MFKQRTEQENALQARGRNTKILILTIGPGMLSLIEGTLGERNFPAWKRIPDA